MLLDDHSSNCTDHSTEGAQFEIELSIAVEVLDITGHWTQEITAIGFWSSRMALAMILNILSLFAAVCNGLQCVSVFMWRSCELKQ